MTATVLLKFLLIYVAAHLSVSAHRQGQRFYEIIGSVGSGARLPLTGMVHALLYHTVLPASLHFIRYSPTTGI